MIDWLKKMKWKKDKDDESAKETLPRLSATEALILQLLLNSSEELYGLQMIEASDGKLKRGTIYVTLQRMEEKGLIESRPEARPKPEIGIPRRMYKATGHGVHVYRAFEKFAMNLQEGII